MSASVSANGGGPRPQLKVAPVTAAIMLLSAPPGVPVHTFVLDRIIEIALGGAIGVLATVFIFPARSRGVVITRSVAVLSVSRTCCCRRPMPSSAVKRSRHPTNIPIFERP